MAGLQNSFAPAVPGACMVPAPGGGAGRTKRGSRNHVLGTAKKRKKAVIPNFGGQSGMLEAEIRVMRLLESGQATAAADLFLKSGGDADPSAGQLLPALLKEGNLSMVTRVAHASKQSALLSQDDVVRCLIVMPHGVPQHDGQAIVEALVGAASWSSSEVMCSFQQMAVSIVLRFLQGAESSLPQTNSEPNRDEYINNLQAISCDDVSSATTEKVSDSTSCGSSVQPTPAQTVSHREPHDDLRDDETSSDIDRDSNVLKQPRHINSAGILSQGSESTNMFFGCRTPDAGGALQRTLKGSPSPFLSGAIADTSSLGLVARAPLAAQKHKKMGKPAGMLGLSGYSSSSTSSEEAGEAEEEVEESNSEA